MKRLFSFAVGVCLLLGQSAHADQIPGSTARVAAWQLAAYDNNKGKFSHCAMSTPYRSGITMYFSVSANYTWRVGWSHAAWHFAKGQGVDLSLFVDDAGPFNLRAEAATENLALAELPAKGAVFDLMRKGYRMSVRAQGNAYAFNLDGTYAALTELLACVERYTAVAAAAPPQPAPMVPPAAPALVATQKTGVTAEQRLEATKVVANILAQGDMTGFHIMSAREIADLKNDYLSRSDVAWRAEGVLGTLRVISSKISASALNSAIIGDDAKDCSGQFASGSTPDEKSPNVLRLFTACVVGGKVTEARYTLVPAGDGTSYLFTTIGQADSAKPSDRTAKVETILRQAVYEVMKQ